MESPNTLQSNGGGISYKEHVPTVTEFLKAHDEYIKDLVEVGKMLIVMERHDRTILEQIHKARPSITVQYLRTVIEFGNEITYPEILHLPAKTRSHILTSGMRFEAQKRIMTQKIEVVTRMAGDKPVVEVGNITDFPQRLQIRATCKKGNTPIKDQVAQILQPVLDVPKPSSQPVESRKRESKGIFAIRRNIAGQWIFEKTTARPFNLQKVLIEEGTATIELEQWAK